MPKRLMTRKTFLQRNAQRVYGGLCGSSNVLLFACGAVAHQPWIRDGAAVSIVAQFCNLGLSDRARSLSTPLLIGSGALFAMSGMHEHMTRADWDHIGFGLCKMAGITALFYGEPIGKWVARAPALRLIGRVLRSRGGITGEILLAIGASNLVHDGLVKLAAGLQTQDVTVQAEGVGTLIAMGLFVSGNRVRSLIPRTPASLAQTLDTPRAAPAKPACR